MLRFVHPWVLTAFLPHSLAGHSSSCVIGTRSKDGSTSFHAVLVDLEGANETIKLKGSAGSKDTKKRKQPESKSRGVAEAKAGAKESNASASAEEGVPLDQRIAKLDLQQNKQQVNTHAHTSTRLVLAIDCGHID